MQKTKVESRKEWVAPELKKVTIEEITSGSGGSRSDHVSGHHS